MWTWTFAENINWVFFLLGLNSLSFHRTVYSFSVPGGAFIYQRRGFYLVFSHFRNTSVFHNFLCLNLVFEVFKGYWPFYTVSCSLLNHCFDFVDCH